MLLSGFYIASTVHIADGCGLGSKAYHEFLYRKKGKAVFAVYLTINLILSIVHYKQDRAPHL